MNVQRAGTVFKKELVDILRDHRTLVAMVLVPILLYPLIMLGAIQAVSSNTADVAQEKIILAFQNQYDWHDVVKPLLEIELDIVHRRRSQAVARGATQDELDAIGTPLADRLGEARITVQLDEAVRQRVVGCGIVVEDQGWAGNESNAPIVITLKYQPEDLRSEYAANRVREALERVAEFHAANQLRARGVDPRVATPIKFQNDPLSTTGSVLGLVLPLVLVLMTITGAIYPAIDLTAGERERGTLESLMVCPIPNIDIIVGKFLVVTTIAIVGAALNLASVTVTLYASGLDQALSESGGAGSGIPLHVLPIILLSLIPFAVFISALMIAVCSCGKSFKEAQNYVTPLIIAVVAAGGIAALPGSKLEGIMMVTPVANMVLLTRELLSGASILPSAFVWVICSSSLYALAAVLIAAQVFGRESVVFSDNLSLRGFLSRKWTVPSQYPSLTACGIYTAVLFPVWFHFQGILQISGDGGTGVILLGSALLMPVMFVALPACVLWWRRVDRFATWGLARPDARSLMAAILLGGSSWVVAHEVFVFQEIYLGTPPSIEAMNQAFVTAVRALHPVGVLMALAIVPAICEELFFRGFLLNGLRGSMKPAAAVLIMAAVFGMFHFLIFKFIWTALLGAILGWLCWRSRSIWPPIITHALHNGITTAGALWPGIFSQLGINQEDPWSHLPRGILTIGFVVFAAGLILVAGAKTRTSTGIEPIVENPARNQVTGLSNPPE